MKLWRHTPRCVCVCVCVCVCSVTLAEDSVTGVGCPSPIRDTTCDKKM